MPILSDKVNYIKRLARAQDYNVRIGRDPLDPSKPLPRGWGKQKTLADIRINQPVRDPLGRDITTIPF